MLNTRMLKNIWPKYQKTFYWVSLMWYKHMKCTHSSKKLILKLKSMHETSIWFDHLEYFLVQKNLNTCRGFRSYNGIPNIYLNWNCILPNKICDSIQLFCTTYQWWIFIKIFNDVDEWSSFVLYQFLISEKNYVITCNGS